MIRFGSISPQVPEPLLLTCINPNSRCVHYKIMSPNLQGRDLTWKNLLVSMFQRIFFDVCLGVKGKIIHSDYTKEPVEKYVGLIEDFKPELIVMEATGGYEKELAPCRRKMDCRLQL